MTPMWTLEQAQELVQLIEGIVEQARYHVAIAGSVATKGRSIKDLDLILYPHTTEQTQDSMSILGHLSKIGLSDFAILDRVAYNRPVYIAYFGPENKRIDIFFLE